MPIPVKVDWSEIVGRLYRNYGSYHAILNAMADQGIVPCDHSFLVYLRSGKRKKVCFEFGAALLNLYAPNTGHVPSSDPKSGHATIAGTSGL